MPQTGDATAGKLVAAGLKLFGRHGFAATGTRALAAEAGTNVASISYHFGSKAGLRDACARAVTERIASVIGGQDLPLPDSRAAAVARLDEALRSFAMFLAAAPGADDLVAFVLRELTVPGEALDLVYERLLEPRHREFCALWGMATGQDPEDPRVRLAVFAMIGQVVYFRIGHAIVARRMGWSAMGRAEAEQIADTVSDHLKAALERSVS